MQITAIDLFAGAGGLSLAALNNGFELRAAVELDGHAAATYRHNILPRSSFPTAVFETDIRKVDWDDLLNKAKLEKGQCDLLLGGPPCQGFSTHRLNGTGISDPRNGLLQHYFRGIDSILPKVFLVENVTGLLWPRHKRYLSRFVKAARDCGYKVDDPIVLNARDYGVPQTRKRVFVLGVRSDLELAMPWPPAATHFGTDQLGKPQWTTAAGVFKKPLSANDPNAIWMKSGQELRDVFRSTPRNGGSRADSVRTLSCHKDHDGHKDVYGRIDPKRPGPTMTTGCINPSKGRFVHPTQNHAISARHAARFQTFPEDFVFIGGLTAAGQQIGNAVPVRLGEALIAVIKRAILATTQKTKSAHAP